MILEYVKGFLTLFLLVKVLLYFVPKNGFAKYIAFFSGVILVVGILYPLLQMFGQEKAILEKLQYEDWERQLLELSENAKEIEEKGMAVLEQQYGEIQEESGQFSEISAEAASIGYEQERIVIEKIKIGGDVQDE